MIRLFTFLVFLFPCCALFAAPPELTSIFPPGAAQGTTVEATLSGTFPTWPVSIWSSDPDLKVEAAGKNLLKIHVKKDAPFGPRLLRVYSKEGASAVRPFWVGTLPEISETEPNDLPAQATKLNGPIVVNGKLSKGGDSDTFSMQLKKGATLVARLQGQVGLDSPMDAVLQILSPAGFVVAENHDRYGLDPVVYYTALADGEYRVRLFAFPSNPDSSIRLAGAENYIYRLTVTGGAYLDHAFPFTAKDKGESVYLPQGWNLPSGASWNIKSIGQTPWYLNKAGIAGWQKIYPSPIGEKFSREASLTLNPPSSISGYIASQVPRKFKLEGTKGEKYSIRVEARKHGSELDPVLILKDAQGKEIRRIDDTEGGPDAKLDWACTGEHALVELTDLHRQFGRFYFFRLSFTKEEPGFFLAVDNDIFTTPKGKEVEVAVKITRQGGHAAPIQFSATLPEGWKASPLQHLPKDGAVAKIKVKAEGMAKPGAFSIKGESQGVSHYAEKPFPPFDTTLKDFWLQEN